MPLYTYSCTGCGIKFERLAVSSARDEQKCSTCGEKASRAEVGTFAVKSTINPKDKVVQTGKEIDLVVGRDSDRRWGLHESAKKERRKDMVEIEPQVSEGSGSTFDSNGSLGDSKRKTAAGVYTDAVKSGAPEVKTEWLDKVDLTSKSSGFRKLEQ